MSLRPLVMTVLPGVTGAKAPAFQIKQQGNKQVANFRAMCKSCQPFDLLHSFLTHM